MCFLSFFALVRGLFGLLMGVLFSVVCCVRFSADGKFLATGCNRTAQIYDAKTGHKTWSVWDFVFGDFAH